MFSSSSKMLAKRFRISIAALALSALCTASSAQGQEATAPPPNISWAPTEGLRLGDLAPQFQLPGATGKTFNSRALLGQKPLILLLDGPSPSLGFNDDIRAAASHASALGFELALVAPNPRIGTDYSWPSPFNTLRAPSGSLNFVAPPSFLAIDRAGWLREIETLPTSKDDAENVRLQFLLSETPDPTPKLEVGKIAPDFQFRDANGMWRRVSALRGRKNLLLTFFPKCFTGKCRSQLISLREAYPAFLATDTEVWAVSVDPAAGEMGQLAFSRELNLPFPLLPDEGRNICLLYGAAKTPEDLALRQSVLIDKNGVVRWTTQSVGVETHGKDVLAKITELGLAQ